MEEEIAHVPVLNEDKPEETSISINPATVVKASDILGREINPDEDETESTKFINREHVAVEYDPGCLAVFDYAPVDGLRISTENGLNSFAEETTLITMKGLISQLWALPTEEDPEGIIAQLPAPITKLPREKPIPQPKLPTRWEAFAQRKGIVKQKRSRIVFDESSQDWVPRYGRDSIKHRAKADEWVIEEDEIKDKERSREQSGKKKKKDYSQRTNDPFEIRDLERSEVVQKQKKNQIRNQRKAQKKSASHLGVIDNDARAIPTLQKKDYKNPKQQMKKKNQKRSAERVDDAIKAAKVSTASMGRFDREVNVRGVKMPKLKKKKEIQSEVAPKSSSEERQRHAKIIKKVLKH